MSERNDIKEGSVAESAKYGLVYTRKCGWIDLGHASPGKEFSALQLWNNILKEWNGPDKGYLSGYFSVTCEQMMRKKFRENIYFAGVSRRYFIKTGLSLDKLKSAALTIFLDTSYEFEEFQAGLPYKWVTQSGFSAEDLVSDLISFYCTVNPGQKYIQMCDPVSKEKALAIWDKYGSVESKEYKNRTFRPLLFPIPGEEGGITVPTFSDLPNFLTTFRTLPFGDEVQYGEF